MPIRVTCVCGHELMAPDKFAGRKARCKSCGEPIRIPSLKPGRQRKRGGAARVEEDYDPYEDGSDDYQPRRRPVAKKKKKRKKKSQGLPGWVVPLAFVFVGVTAIGGLAFAFWPQISLAVFGEPPEPTRTVAFEGLLFDI